LFPNLTSFPLASLTRDKMLRITGEHALSEDPEYKDHGATLEEKHKQMPRPGPTGRPRREK